MRKFTLFGVIFLVIAGLAYASSQVWIEKPYQQWDEKDIKEILIHSPWIKQTTVMSSWGKTPLAEDNSAPSPQGMPSGRPGSMGGNPGQGGQQPGMGQEPPTAEGQNVTYIIRWNSAQTIRDAIARQTLLNGKATQAQMEQYIDQQPATYDIWVYGPDMTPFAKETESTLQSKVYLQVKPSKEKENPATVQIVKSPDGSKIVGVLFSFAKQGPDGKPLIAPNDKQAHFECKTKLANLSTTFDLRKMVGKNGQEL